MHDLDDIPDPIPAELAGKRTYMRRLHRAHTTDRLGTEELKEIKRTYYGMTSRMDAQLGEVMEALREQGFYDDTVVAFFSDHGDYAGDYGMIEKYLAGFEDCLLHVPLVLGGPGVPEGFASGCLCEMTDLYPTLMELVGLEPRHYHFGRSLGPVLRGESEEHRDAVFAEGGHHRDEEEKFHVNIPENSIYRPMYRELHDDPKMARRAMMVRTEGWKYVYSPWDRDELFNLEKDPLELRNVADSADHADVVAGLRERLLRWMLRTGDVLPPDRDPRGWSG
jgi:arylsulfatase A-like enzyme